MVGADVTGLLPVPLTDIAPNPLWIPVVLSAVLYGRLLGVLTVGLVTLAQGFIDWRALVNYPDLYAYLVDHSKEPLLWLLTASLLGGIRDKQFRRHRETEAVMEQRTVEAQALAHRCQVLRREVALLEHRIAASGASAAGATMLALDWLRDAPLSRSLENFEQVLQKLIGAKGVSVYFPVRDHWIAASGEASDVDGNGYSYADEITAEICREAAAVDRVLSCVRDGDGKLLKGRAAMATSIARNRFTGVVLVREVDPACLTSAGESALSLASFILASRTVLERARTVEHSLAREARRGQRRPRLQLVNERH
jgi:hypothetical protein